MAMRPKSVSNWKPSKPSKDLCDSAVLQPNAKDNKDSLTPDSPYTQAVGGSGKPSGDLGPRGRNF